MFPLSVCVSTFRVYFYFPYIFSLLVYIPTSCIYSHSLCVLTLYIPLHMCLYSMCVLFLYKFYIFFCVFHFSCMSLLYLSFFHISLIFLFCICFHSMYIPSPCMSRLYICPHSMYNSF